MLSGVTSGRGKGNRYYGNPCTVYGGAMEAIVGFVSKAHLLYRYGPFTSGVKTQKYKSAFYSALFGRIKTYEKLERL